MRKSVLALLMITAVAAAACSVVGGSNLVPTTGDTANDPSAAQRFVPDLPGYISTNASNITDAISTVTGGASLLTGNLASTAMIAQIDGMIQCYQNTGSMAAKVYVQADVASLVQGQLPSAGALAVLNQDRIINNFLPCALGSGAQGLSAQNAEPQPCSGSGSFTVDNETLYYLYAATEPNLCAQFQALFPVG
jgi:hypothetical protein